MNDNLEYSDNGFKVTKYFEGCKLRAYWDSLGKVWTIGYGHTPAQEGQIIDQDQADLMLRLDIGRTASFVKSYIKVDLTQGQFDALVDFTFNEGIGHLRFSTLLIYVNQGNFEEAAREFSKWVFAGGKVNDWQAKRRKADLQLFLEQEVTLD